MPEKKIVVERPAKNLQEDALNNYERSVAEQNKADVYYIAMMAGIDIDSIGSQEVAE